LKDMVANSCIESSMICISNETRRRWPAINVIAAIFLAKVRRAIVGFWPAKPHRSHGMGQQCDYIDLKTRRTVRIWCG